MQTNLNPSPSLESRGILGKDAFQNVNDMIRSLATLQSGDTRPAGIKSGEFWCKDLEGNGTKFQVFRYIEVTTPEGVQKTDIPWTIELVQSISASESASTDKSPSEKAVAIALDKKIDKSAISSAIDSASEETVLSSLGAKMLNEKIINNKKVTLLEERTAIGNVTLTGVEVGKPIFIISSQPTVNGMAYAYMSCLSGSLDGIVPNSTITAMCLGLQSGNYSTNIACVIPTQDTVVFNISVMTGGYIVRFYQ